MTACPPLERLFALLADELTPDEEAPLSAHVEGCDTCQRELDGLSEHSGPARTTRNDPEPSAAFLTRLKSVALGPDDGPRPIRADRSSVSLAGYDVLAEVGRGGMGVVYEAVQLSLGRPVAVKMLPGWGGPAELARLRAEAGVLAGLSHPHIVQIYEVGESDGRAYLAMEFVAGGTLKDRCGKPADPVATAELVRTLAEAIHTAHAKGIVHRDLKPSNVLLARDGAPKIGDFGLAFRLATGGDRLTRTGEMIGTPQYMAPEQADPTVGPVSAATDVYALGVILYELLTGRPPFDGAGPAETVRRVLAEEPLSLRRLRPTVSRDLETIAHKCLEKAPTRRYPTAAELADDLGRFAAGLPIRARPVSVTARAVRWGQRNPLPAGLLFALGLSLAIGLVGTTTLWLAADRHRLVAVGNLADAEASRSMAEQLLYFNRIARAGLEWRLSDAAEARELLGLCAPVPGRPDPRGWEWHYLKGLTDADLMTIPAAHTTAFAVTFAPDGRLFTGGGDPFRIPGQPTHCPGQLRCWDAAGWRADAPVWEGSGGVVIALAVSPDGRRVVSAGMDGRVRVWDTDGGPPRHTLGPKIWVNDVAISPDSQRVAWSSDDEIVRVAELETGKDLYSVRGRGVTFRPDGAVLATCQEDGIHLWDATTGRPVRVLPGEAGRSVVFSPDGNRLAVGNRIRMSVLRADDGRRLWATGSPEAQVMGFAFDSDGRRIATAGADGVARVFDAETGSERLTLRGHAGRVAAVAFHPAGRQLASVGQEAGEVKVWDLARNPEYVTADPAGRMEVEAVGFAADGRHVTVVRRGGRVRVSDADTGSAVLDRSVGLTGEWVVPSDPAAFSPDGRRLAGVTTDRRVVTIGDVATGTERVRLTGHTVPVVHVSWSGDGRRIVTAAAGPAPNRIREVKVWDADGEVRAAFAPALPPSGSITIGAAALGPEGGVVAFDDYDETSGKGRVRVIDFVAGERFSVAVPSVVRAISFSTDSRRLVVLDRSGGILVLDAAHGQPVYPTPLAGPVHGPGAAAFSPDGRLLAAVDRDHVKLWHVESGQEVLTLHGAPPRWWNPGFTPRVTWSRDGRRLAASNWDNSVSVWDAADRSTPAELAARRAQVTAPVPGR